MADFSRIDKMTTPNFGGMGTKEIKVNVKPPKVYQQTGKFRLMARKAVKKKDAGY